MKSAKELFEESIKRADNAINYSPKQARGDDGKWTSGGGATGKSSGVKRVVREDKYIKQVTHSLKVNGGKNTIESDMIYDKTKEKVMLNASATGSISVKDTMAYHNMISKSVKEGIAVKGHIIVAPKEGITKEVRDSTYIKQVDFNAKPDGMWTSSRVTKVKKDGLGEKAGDITINTSATGDLSIQQMQTHQYMVYQAIREANKI